MLTHHEIEFTTFLPNFGTHYPKQKSITSRKTPIISLYYRNAPLKADSHIACRAHAVPLRV
jgi:hypothetical protein